MGQLETIPNYVVLKNLMKLFLKIFIKILELFYQFVLKNPQFQGQTKEKLVNDDLNKIIENPIKVKIENWLINNKKISSYIIDRVISNLNERKLKKKELDIRKKTKSKS